MGEFDEDFNAEIFQELHLKILQERDGQWVVGGGEVVGEVVEEVVGEVGGEAKPKEGELEVMEVWISQSCYMEEDPKCHVKGHPAIKSANFSKLTSKNTLKSLESPINDFCFRPGPVFLDPTQHAAWSGC